jgi:putative ABC transport system permease protein
VKPAQAEMDTISRRLEQQYPADDKGWGASVVPLHEDIVAKFRPALLVLLGAVAFVLLISCANVANLILAKTLDRRREIAIRAALGATRARIVQQVMSESVVLSLVGGMFGLATAEVAVIGARQYLTQTLPRALEIRIDGSILVFTVVISVLTGVLAGLFPAWRLSHANVNDALKQGLGQTSLGTSSNRTRSTLVVLEVALSLMLLAGAGLLLRSFWNLQNVDPGFNPRNVLTAHYSVGEKKFSSPQQQMNFDLQILQRVRQISGLKAAALMDDLPLEGGSNQPVLAQGQPAVPMSEQPNVAVREVSSDIFKALAVPVIKGREFSDSDTPEAQRVTIVSEAFAKKFWPNQDPIGKYLTLSFFQGGPRTVVGVVKDARLWSLDDTSPTMAVYRPVTQPDPPDKVLGDYRSRGLGLALRTEADPKSLVQPLINALHEVSADMPVTNVMPMEQLLDDSLMSERFNLLLLASFAGVALTLAALGIYSVLAYTVRRRTAEIGIRMALGAQVADVMKMVLRDGMFLVAAGIIGGLLGALAVTRFLKSMLYGVGTSDAPTLSAVALLLTLVALFACYMPARRAMRVDPVTALKNE